MKFGPFNNRPNFTTLANVRSARNQTTSMNTNYSQHRNIPRTCTFCNQSHWNDDCTAYRTAESRRQRLRELRRCYNCLKTNHNVNQCVMRPQCFYCKRGHRSFLCPEKFPYNRGQTNQAHAVVDTQSQLGVFKARQTNSETEEMKNPGKI